MKGRIGCAGRRAKGVTAPLIVACAAVGLTGCGSGSNESAANSGSGSGSVAYEKTETAGTAGGSIDQFSWSVYTEPPTLDWSKGSNTYPPATVLANVCESLLRQNPDYSITPALAESFAHPDSTTWTYKIRKGVKFHSGGTLKPSDVVFSLRRAADGKAGSVLAGSFANVKSIAATGPDTVTVKLSKPDALFNQSMAVSSGIIDSEAYVKAKGDTYGTPQGGVDCTGPFSLADWKKGSEIDLSAFDGYWDDDLKPKAKTVVLKFLEDPAARATALRTGSVDGAYYITPSGTQSLRDVSSGSLYYGANPTVRSMMVFHQEDGPLKDPRLRRALSLALDRPAIVKAALGGIGAPAPAVVARDGFAAQRDVFQQAWDELPSADEPNITEAKKLVDEVGKPTGPIVIASSNADPSYDLTALAVQSAGKQIGLDIKIKRLPIQLYNALFADESQRKGIDLFQTTWNLDYADPLEFYGLFAIPLAYNNFVDFKDSQYTALASKALGIDDPKQRAEATVELQDRFLELMPWIPLFEVPNTVFLNKRLGGAPTSSAYLSYPWAALIGAAG